MPVNLPCASRIHRRIRTEALAAPSVLLPGKCSSSGRFPLAHPHLSAWMNNLLGVVGEPAQLSSARSARIGYCEIPPPGQCSFWRQIPRKSIGSEIRRAFLAPFASPFAAFAVIKLSLGVLEALLHRPFGRSEAPADTPNPPMCPPPGHPHCELSFLSERHYHFRPDAGPHRPPPRQPSDIVR